MFERICKELKFMAENTLNKIKNGALSCACSVLNKINIATEESRLKAKYESLGRRLLPALEKDALDERKNDPETFLKSAPVSAT